MREGRLTFPTALEAFVGRRDLALYHGRCQRAARRTRSRLT